MNVVPLPKAEPREAIDDVLGKLMDGNQDGALAGLLIVCLGTDGKLSYVRAGSANFLEVLGGLRFLESNILHEMTEVESE